MKVLFIITTDDGETISLANYSNTSITDLNSAEVSVSFHYVVSSNLLGGTLIVTTNPDEGGSALVRNFSQPYPYSGTIIVIGADNQRARLSISGGMPTDTVTIEYALDGDGVYNDGMDVLSWSDFEAQAAYALDPVLD